MTGSKSAEEALASGGAWDDFCDRLKESGRRVLAPGTPTSGLDRAEGFRCLTRYLRVGLDSMIEHGDPERPTLHSLSGETIKIIADNPDIFYQNCSLRGDCEYRITGTRGTVDYLSFGTQRGSYGRTGTMEPTGAIDSTTLQVDPDGSFEILVSQTPQPVNWLPMTPDTSTLIIRQTFLDRRRERKADLAIERLVPATELPTLSPETFVRKLEAAANFVDGTSALAFGWAERLAQRPNELPAADQAYCQGLGGDPNFYYYHGYWKLAKDEALILEPTFVPECKAWNFQLDNYWMESLDYSNYPIHTNKHLANTREDGSFTIVVAHQDPGVENWISTVGHDQGTMCFRWVGASEFPEIEAKVVRVSSLGS